MADIIVTRDGPVLRIKLNRPESRNALNYDLIDQILDELEPAAGDDDCRVVVLSGEGNGFCAGDDLKGMGQPTGTRWRRSSRPLLNHGTTSETTGPPLVALFLCAMIRTMILPFPT